MKPMTDNPLDRIPESPKPSVGIWFAFIGPISMALLHLQFSYVLEHTACSTGTKLQTHIFSVISVFVIAWAYVVAHRHWVAAGSDDPGQHAGPIGTERLMALGGMILSGISMLFVLAQWFPNFILPVCIRT
jgi:hypothetical protein